MVQIPSAKLVASSLQYQCALLALELKLMETLLTQPPQTAGYYLTEDSQEIFLSGDPLKDSDSNTEVKFLEDLQLLHTSTKVTMLSSMLTTVVTMSS